MRWHIPAVRFKLTVEGAPTLQTSGSGDRREVLASLYGLDTARQMLEVVASDEGINLTGFISPLSITRSNRREITFFINGRWVQDIPLAAALIQAYHTLIMVGRYPLATLFVELPPEEVDVNVHPAKSEVRFRQPDRIFSAVQRAVRRALLAYTPVPTLEPGRSWWSTAPANPAPRVPDPAWEMAGDVRQSSPTDTNRPQDPNRTCRQVTPAAAGGAGGRGLPGGRRSGWAVPDRPACRPRTRAFRDN